MSSSSPATVLQTKQLPCGLHPSLVRAWFGSHCRLGFVFSLPPLPSPSAQLCVGLRAANLCGEGSKTLFAFKIILGLCSKDLIQVTIPCHLLWNARKRLQLPLHLLGFIKINPYEISKRGDAAGLQPLVGRAGNLRWEGASWVTAVWVIFCNMLPCNPFRKAAAFHDKVGEVSCSLSCFKLL